jgi:hypothetical protein
LIVMTVLNYYRIWSTASAVFQYVWSTTAPALDTNGVAISSPDQLKTTLIRKTGIPNFTVSVTAGQSPYSVLSTGGTISASTTAAITVNLPSALLTTNKIFYFMNTGTNNLTVVPFGAQTIDGAVSVVIAAGNSLAIQSNGTIMTKDANVILSLLGAYPDGIQQSAVAAANCISVFNDVDGGSLLTTGITIDQSNNLTIPSGGSLVLNGALSGTSLAITGNETVGGTLGVTGATTLTTLATSGGATLASTSVTGNETVGGTLGVTGATTLTTLATSGAATLASAAVTGNETVGGTLGVTGATTLTTLATSGGATLASASVTGGETVGGTLGVTGATTLTTLSTSGAATLASASVTGNETVGGTLGVTGTTTLTTLATSGAATLASATVTANETVGGTLGVTGATTLTTLATSGAATLASAAVTGGETVGGTLGVTGATSLSTLGTSGLATLNSASVTTTLGVTGATTLSTLSTSGAATLASAAVTGATTLTTLSTSGAATLASASVTGNETVGGTLGVSGATTLASASVTGNETVGGTLSVTGVTTLTTLGTSGLATLNSSSITNNETVGGTLTVTGVTTLGSVSATAVTGPFVAPQPLVFGGSAATGTSTSLSRGDHVHALPRPIMQFHRCFGTGAAGSTSIGISISGTVPTAWNSVMSFYYRGSTFNVGLPQRLGIIYSVPAGTTTFNVRLFDVTNGNAICTIAVPAGAAIETYLESTTITNTPAAGAVFEIQVQRSAGSANALSLFSTYFEY